MRRWRLAGLSLREWPGAAWAPATAQSCPHPRGGPGAVSCPSLGTGPCPGAAPARVCEPSSPAAPGFCERRKLTTAQLDTSLAGPGPRGHRAPFCPPGSSGSTPHSHPLRLPKPPPSCGSGTPDPVRPHNSEHVTPPTPAWAGPCAVPEKAAVPATGGDPPNLEALWGSWRAHVRPGVPVVSCLGAASPGRQLRDGLSSRPFHRKWGLGRPDGAHQPPGTVGRGPGSEQRQKRTLETSGRVLADGQGAASGRARGHQREARWAVTRGTGEGGARAEGGRGHPGGSGTLCPCTWCGEGCQVTVHPPEPLVEWLRLGGQWAWEAPCEPSGPAGGWPGASGWGCERA